MEEVRGSSPLFSTNYLSVVEGGVLVIPPELEGILVSTPDTLHGAIRFSGTRVFAYQLFDYILTGRTLDQFMDDFEGVGRDQAKAVMRWQLEQVHRELEPIAK